MKVGDLVKVKRKYREDTLGLVLEVKQDDNNRVIIVQPVNPGLQVYANPVDVEVINASR
jgi:outer membrane lipoprotein SlyB